ncbi:MAG: Zn-ribbon domain-containing OB-fold protein [Dehalococcoidia bacterium]
MSTTTEYEKPLPIKTDENAPYWESAKQQELRLQRCSQCGKFRYPPAPFCPHCLSSEAEWRPISGKATVYSYIIVHQRYDPSFAGDLPYNVTIVELEEGPRFVTNVVDCRNEDLRIGMPLLITYQVATEEFTLPKFGPA